MLIIAFKLYMIIVQAMWYEFQTCSHADKHDKQSNLDAKVAHKVHQSHDSNCVINQSETEQVHDLKQHKYRVKSAYHVSCLSLKLERGALDDCLS